MLAFSHVLSPRKADGIVERELCLEQKKKDVNPIPAPSFTISMILGRSIMFLHLCFLFVNSHLFGSVVAKD